MPKRSIVLLTTVVLGCGAPQAVDPSPTTHVEARPTQPAAAQAATLRMEQIRREKRAFESKNLARFLSILGSKDMRAKHPLQRLAKAHTILETYLVERSAILQRAYDDAANGNGHLTTAASAYRLQLAQTSARFDQHATRMDTKIPGFLGLRSAAEATLLVEPSFLSAVSAER